MKLLRWAVAGASVYAVYKYSIGKDAKGEDVISSPEREIEKLEAEEKGAAKPRKTKKAPESS